MFSHYGLELAPGSSGDHGGLDRHEGSRMLSCRASVDWVVKRYLSQLLTVPFAIGSHLFERLSKLACQSA
jgi:hypothetical protein